MDVFFAIISGNLFNFVLKIPWYYLWWVCWGYEIGFRFWANKMKIRKKYSIWQHPTWGKKNQHFHQKSDPLRFLPLSGSFSDLGRHRPFFHEFFWSRSRCLRCLGMIKLIKLRASDLEEKLQMISWWISKLDKNKKETNIFLNAASSPSTWLWSNPNTACFWSSSSSWRKIASQPKDWHPNRLVLQGNEGVPCWRQKNTSFERYQCQLIIHPLAWLGKIAELGDVLLVTFPVSRFMFHKKTPKQQ